MTKQEEILLRKKAMDWGYDANKTNQFIEFAKQKQEITKTPIQQEQPQQDGILKSIIKDPVKELLVRPAVRATQLGIAGIGGGIGALTGNEKLKNRALDYSQQEQNVSLPLLGNFNIPGQKTGMSGAKQVVGDALKSASYLYTPGAAAGTVRAGLGGAVKTAAIQGAKGGAIGLGAYQAGQAMQDDKSLGQVAYEGLKGAAIGGVTGGVLGGGIGAATYGVQKGIGMVTKAGDKLKDKATSDLEGKYNEIFTGTKAGTKKLDKSLSRGKDPAKFLAEHGYIVDVENGKVMSTGLVDRMKQDVQPLEDVLDEILKAKDAKMATSQRINLSKLAAQVKRSLTTDFNKASGDLSKMYAMVDDVIGELRTQYGDDVGLSALNQIKRGQWGQTGFDLTKPKYSSEVSYKIGSAAKKAIEDAVSEADIKQLNSYIGDYFNSITLLNQVNGNAIKGGRLGKYFARTIGAVAGAKAGPIGSLAGAITGDTIANIMQNNYISNPIKRMLLQRIMRQTGVSSPIYQAAQEALKELTRIPLLPAGGGVNQAGRVINNNPINLPSKLPNYGDEAAFKGKGALSRGGSKAKDFLEGMTDTNIGLATKNTIKDPLISEARKYKSAEEFVGFMRGSATQYGGYNPKLRATIGLSEDSARLSDLGINPDLEVTIYRGIDGDIRNPKFNDGDFVTTDKLSAQSYTGGQVISKKVKAKDLIADSAKEFDKNDPFYTGAEFVYSDSKNKVTNYSKSQLIDIWNKANKNTAKTAGELFGAGATTLATYFGSKK